jgi:hypothetical protein
MAAYSITYNLFVALIILTSMIIVLALTYFLIRYIGRHRAAQHQSNVDVEDTTEGRISRLSHRFSQQPTIRQQRLSSVPPSIELIPALGTSEDSAEKWLRRGNGDGGVDVTGGDLGVKIVPKVE